MTAVQRRRRLVAGTAAIVLSPTLVPHLVRGDGLWLLAVVATGLWAASHFRVAR